MGLVPGFSSVYPLYMPYVLGLINIIDMKAKCCHLKNLPVKGLCGRCLSKFARLEKHLVILVCSTQHGHGFWASDR